ncbi:MAG: C40 family peptidase [Bacteroidales bacterium]|nr:C40 family peptidase [Bacteroidales bacterium]
MTTYGINTHAVLPMRSEDSECSEMISQLLFGEFFQVITIKERWCYIHTFLDDYKGWVDRKMVSFIPDELYDVLASVTLPTLIKPIVEVDIDPDKERMILSAGSILPFYENGHFTLLEKTYYVPEESVAMPSLEPETNLISTAFSFLNVPYLWGGKNVLGMDCSGFVQIVFRINGILLPRDARLQILHGETVHSVEQVKSGDLAFFENAEGRVTHVGIALEGGEIIHESGRVRVDRLDDKGIFNEERGLYTHQLKAIKRYF